MKSEVLHFVIEGAFITQRARELWGEDDGPGALRLLATIIGLPDDAKQALLEGRKQLMGTSDDPGIYLADDNAKTDKHGRPLKTMLEFLTDERAKLTNERNATNDAVLARTGDTVMMGSPWGKMFVPRPLTGRTRSGKPKLLMEWSEFEERFPSLVEAAKECSEKAREDEVLYPRRQKKFDIKELNRRVKAMGDRAFSPYAGIIATMDPRLQAAAAAILDPPKVCPAPDKGLETMNGWINPEGKLYPCGFMGHDNLAHLLGKTVAILEKSWVKLQDRKDPGAPCDRPGDHDFQHIPDRGVTQAQLNTMGRWCAKHSRPMPTNIEVR